MINASPSEIRRYRMLLLISLTLYSLISCLCLAQAVPFAEDGTLKMLYDNRMYPQAVEVNGHIHIVWRGAHGLPHIVSYDLTSGSYSEPFMLLTGLGIEIDAQKTDRDSH
jgi:hypothetical protein